MKGETAMLRSIMICAALFFVEGAVMFFAPAVQAREMQLTIYDDGRSSPGDCDAHVVFYPSDNGTRYAFQPSSSRLNPAACVEGNLCRICFGEADSSCMDALYRGGGPKAGRFDFTPAFYQANCSRTDIPAALRAQCDSLDSAAKKLKYSTAINCFLTPNDAKCVKATEQASAAQAADMPKYNSCIALGQTKFNAAQSDPKERRSNECNYSALALGGHPGNRWRLLLPAACRPGTYVDQFGLDCCSSDVRFAAANHPECRAFFPNP
jgi:hypothetical protein